MSAKPEKMLLHLCCGPCGEYPIEALKSYEKYDLTLFFYNPNIHPEKEWYRRLEGAMRLAQLRKLPICIEERCDPRTWSSYGRTPERCEFCYENRMSRVAEYAAENDFDIFTTSLLVSPYQQQDLIHAYGKQNAKKYQIEFLAADFTDGFRKGQQMAREDGLYRQKYCGCALSLADSDFLKKIRKEQANYIVPKDLKAKLKEAGVLCL
ncbi:MAG TPA: epoxyqueuosine reductase QueH [Candidatus Eisenbacteria bacterium]|nr:epoxyqueuosine reductase QueH [Candidatus Eisenbacteria bacterium]